MPKKATELPAVAVARLTKPGFHAVGGVAGLHLQVALSGARSWILRATVGRKRRDIGLGGYPDVPLARAREKARELREAIRQGVDPVAERQQARQRIIAAQRKTMTFGECVDRFIASQEAGWRNDKHRAQWRSTLESYAGPVMGNLPIDQIEVGHVMKVLEPIWTTNTETAKRLRGRIESVLAWATTHGYRSGDNPARWRGHLDTILPMPSRVANVQHFKALPIDRMHRFMRDLRRREGIAARALEFAILTAARSGEVRGATWEEVDLDKQLWTIPAERMKAKRVHVVPLSVEALSLLKQLPRSAGSDLIFPGARGRPLSDVSLLAVLRRMGVDATAHGFRSTFRDWCSERSLHSSEVAEMALAHSIRDKTEAAYRRGDLLAKRRKLMSDWANFLKREPGAGEVAPIRGREALA